ncbi:IQ domain-containing protein F5 [Chrysemys picta bellii]|uniref:IQ domain-containing protein F5 n=1 Tax=Chrysemys picta bellii TaxID=8478 RepID=UPI0032B2DE22
MAGVKALEGSPRKKPDAKALKNSMVRDSALGGGDDAQRQLLAAPDSLQQLGAPDQAAAMDFSSSNRNLCFSGYLSRSNRWFPVFSSQQKAISPPLSPSPEKDPSSKSAIAIQSWWRGVLTRRTVRQATLCVLVIQRWWRRVSFWQQEERRVTALAMYVRPMRATVLLQSLVRMWRARSQYKKYQRAVLVIQNKWRHYACRREAAVFAGSSLADGGVDLNIEIIVG